LSGYDNNSVTLFFCGIKAADGFKTTKDTSQTTKTTMRLVGLALITILVSCCAMRDPEENPENKEKRFMMGGLAQQMVLEAEKVRIISEAHQAIHREAMEKQSYDEKSGKNVTAKIQF